MEVLMAALANPTTILAILSLIEVVLGAIPNNIFPYKSVILGLFKILGSKSQAINDFTLEKSKVVENVSKVSLVLLILLFAGCSHFTITDKASFCESLQEGDSLICDLSKKVGQSPEMIAAVLKIANVGFLAAKPESAGMVYDYICQIEVLVAEARGQGILYPVLREYVIEKYFEAPEIVQANIIVLRGLVEEYTDFKTRMLTDIDIDMVLYHLNDQQQILAPFLKK